MNKKNPDLFSAQYEKAMQKTKKPITANSLNYSKSNKKKKQDLMLDNDIALPNANEPAIDDGLELQERGNYLKNDLVPQKNQKRG